jgi:two-component system OmpR family response regulator
MLSEPMQSTPHILVVDDDREIRELLSRFLRKHGFRVDVAANGREMKGALERAKIDLVLLDRVMPGEDGLTLCREIREQSRVPVIMLTLLGNEMDRIVGFEMGADDYIVKPYSPNELVARVKAVLRRASELPPQNRPRQAALVLFAGWAMDRRRREIESPEGVVVTLTDGEFDLLLAFVEHPQMVLTREQLLDLARGRSGKAFDRSIDMQVTRLRRKIEADPNEPVFIKTVRNKGYIFTPDVVWREL